MSLLDDYVNDRINVYEYGARMTELLNEPLDDKAAQHLLQKACEDVELLDAKRPPDYREVYLTKSDVKQRAARTLAELQSLGYVATR